MPSRGTWSLGLALALSVAACNVVTGSGNLISEVRDLGGFTEVQISDGMAAEVTVDSSAPFSVVVRYDDNLIDQVVTRLDGNTLVIEYDGNVNLRDADRAIEIAMPRLDRAGANGGAALAMTGAVESYSIEASGGAAVNAAELTAQSVTVDASGGSAVTLFAVATVAGRASGGAAVEILGSPSVADVDTSGGARVEVVR